MIDKGLPQVCAVYIQRASPSGEPEVLLGRKKTGLGRGHLVAPGGKLEPEESPGEAAVREVREEVGLELSRGALQLIGELNYLFPHRTEWSQKSWVFTTRYAEGVVEESDELAPLWVSTAVLPWSQMWDDAKYWLPDALRGQFAKATFAFGPDGVTVESSDHPNFTV